MKKYLGLIIVAILAGSLSAYIMFEAMYSKIPARQYSGQETFDSRSFKDIEFEEGHFPDFTFAAEMSVKAVVHVKVVIKEEQQPATLFDFFFGYRPSQPREIMGSGSGVIISDDGYIITNNHVIEGADNIEVVLNDNRKFKAKLVGTDPVTDIALLKIDASGLPVIPFGNSDDLRLGEWVLAIGNPYNLTSTITAGIVSAKARSMPNYTGEFKIESFIQTDAAVNPGNSGGALVNTKGELVGINTAIASNTGSYSGYSFAVPVTIAEKVVDDIKKFGMVRRAVLGVTMIDVTADLEKEKGLSVSEGAYIHSVKKNSAAGIAGIKEGDVIIGIEDRKISKGAEVMEEISKRSPEEEITVSVMRNGQETDFKVKLQGSDEGYVINEKSAQIFGAVLTAADKAELERLSLEWGVKVESVDRGKFNDAGIRKGFIITHINQTAAQEPQDVISLIGKSRRSVLIEGVYPNGNVCYYGIGL